MNDVEFDRIQHINDGCRNNFPFSEGVEKMM